MKYLWLLLSWILTMLCLLFAIGVGLSAPLITVPLFLITVLLAPPFHGLIERTVGRQISAKSKAILNVFLFVAYIIAGGVVSEKRSAAEVETVRQKKIMDFQAERGSLIANANKALQEKRFADVMALTAKWREIGDAELNQLRSDATGGLEAQRRGEEVEKKRLRDLARTKEILAELPKISVEDHKRNFELYAELAKLTPDDVGVKQMMETHQKKFEEQKKKDRLAAQKAEEEAKEKAAIDKKIEAQFSPWDGSHRNLEKWIKKQMNDPDSYKHVETTYKKDGAGLRVLTVYRGKNAFGGVVKNSVLARVDLDGNVVEILTTGP